MPHKKVQCQTMRQSAKGKGKGKLSGQAVRTRDKSVTSVKARRKLSCTKDEAAITAKKQKTNGKSTNTKSSKKVVKVAPKVKKARTIVKKVKLGKHAKTLLILPGIESRQSTLSKVLRAQSQKHNY